MANIANISDTVSLAFHAMTLLARHPERRVSSSEVARIFDASEHTIAMVMKRLVQAGMADSVRGARGGFRLAAVPSKVTLLDIYEIFEGAIGERHCMLGKPACSGKKCVMGGLVNRLNSEARDYFVRTTLAELAKEVELGDETFGEVRPSDRRKSSGRGRVSRSKGKSGTQRRRRTQ